MSRRDRYLQLHAELTRRHAAKQQTTPTAQLRVVSFGTVHGGLPADIVPDIAVNVADFFRDPHRDPELVNLTGADDRVVNKVLSTDGVYGFLNTLFGVTQVLLGQQVRTVTVAVGCSGGRHRSVVIADMLGSRFDAVGMTVEVQHLHVDRPVTRRPKETDHVG